MKKINYISSIDTNDYSGGWSAMNHFIYQGLSKCFELNNIAGVNPNVSKIQWYVSKLKRLFGLKGNFFFYSESRLDAIAEKVYKEGDKTAEIDFFHGTTPWVKVSPSKEYYCYADAVFPTYLNNYVKSEKFSKRDILRIMAHEKVFLEAANGVFFSSEWALNEARSFYNLSGENFIKVGLGGAMSGEVSLVSPNNINLLFISLDFEGKGGRIAFEVFKQLKEQYISSKLTIIGEVPPTDVANSEGVYYLGRLNKEKPGELELFKQTIKESTCLIHPTEKDATPLVLVECGLLGTPSLASYKFGIPEMILPSETGYTVKNWYDTNDVIEKIVSIHNNPYIREKTAKHFLTNFSWDTVVDRIKTEINSNE